jgi:hypothetical protein
MRRINQIDAFRGLPGAQAETTPVIFIVEPIDGFRFQAILEHKNNSIAQ